MNRRDLLTLLGGAAAWPVAARAQAMPVIGFLDAKSADFSAHLVSAFRQGLKETGYDEGKNVLIEYRWADGQFDRVPALAAELVRRQVSVIAAISPASALAAKAATTAIPIVFQSGFDPVDAGLVTSLNRPGSNLTGISRLATDLVPKLLQLVREAAPSGAVVAYLMNPASPSAETQRRNLQIATRSLGIQQLVLLSASTEGEIDEAFANLTQQRAGALTIGQDSFFNDQIEKLAALTVLHAVPAIYSLREFAEAGGLMSYGASLADQYRLVGVYVGRVLKGEKPADLPVQQSTKVELVINLKTARSLGLVVPPSLLAIADEVIE